MIQGVSTSAEAIIDSLQPYHRGANAEEDALWVLRELNNVDKHRLLLVTTITMEGPLEFEFNPPLRVDLRDRPKGAIDMEFFHGGPIKNGGVFARFRTTSSEVKMDRKPFSTVAFDEAGFARGKPVIPLLSETSGIVREIIESFRSEFI